MTSITADGPPNVLVAGLSDGNLAVSTGLEGPWFSSANTARTPPTPGDPAPLPVRPVPGLTPKPAILVRFALLTGLRISPIGDEKGT